MKTTTKTYYKTTEFGDFQTSKVIEHTYEEESEVKSLEAKNAELEASYEKLAFTFDDLNVQNNFHAKSMVELEKKLEEVTERLENQTHNIAKYNKEWQWTEEKLKIAVSALEHLSIGNNLSLSNRDALLKFIADREAVSIEALAAIKEG